MKYRFPSSGVLSRCLHALAVIILAYVFTFLIICVLPGDPVSNILLDPDNGFTEEDIKPIIAYYGLDRPVLEQLWMSASRFLAGDFGVSLRSNTPVSHLMSQALPPTVVLACSALAVALVLAFALAYAACNLRARWARAIARSLPSVSLSIPGFVIGLLLIHVFAFQLGFFRITDPDSATATLFAALALGIPVSAQIAEVLIANLDHEGRQDYVMVATARGLGTERLYFRHLLRPSALPVVTMVALAVGELLGGSLITEAIFGRQGMGSLVQSAVAVQDFPVLQAVVSLAAAVFVIVNLLADLVYPKLDPRLRGTRRNGESA
ncbi:Glutathione transport system permease protein GsiC [Achromobacter insuavis]|uniref:ABC transporter permease n=1 Tax=Achromobacter insuavis TaxID=1287735 RepID=UPI001466C9AC|nr:ABC transporter permease [Achromobacter insuavis]CAB3893081.1 Glutathione transport system permease protein GsiC [Achromobacter insuavis]